MDTYFLKSEDIFKFYERIAMGYRLYAPVRVKSSAAKEDDYALNELSEVNREKIVFNQYRPVEPVRVFFTHFKEKTCAYFQDSFQIPEEKPLALCGLKNCDLFSLKIQDFVFLGGDTPDPFYQKRREEALLISSDCTGFKEVCFCRALDINPHPKEGFDFNLSPLNNGYLLDVASEKAKAIVKSIGDIFTPATVGQLSARLNKRESVIKCLEERLEPHKIPKKETLRDIVLSGYNSGLWQEEAKNCVECGACVFVCDTCHCFLLGDEKEDGEAKRTRAWDGCLFKNFARVAGGANPMKRRFMRLRNRYLKKFDFFVENMDLNACCGCGRCIEACPGEIDIRRILRKLDEEKHLSAN